MNRQLNKGKLGDGIRIGMSRGMPGGSDAAIVAMPSPLMPAAYLGIAQARRSSSLQASSITRE